MCLLKKQGVGGREDSGEVREVPLLHLYDEEGTSIDAGDYAVEAGGNRDEMVGGARPLLAGGGDGRGDHEGMGLKKGYCQHCYCWLHPCWGEEEFALLLLLSLLLVVLYQMNKHC